MLHYLICNASLVNVSVSGDGEYIYETGLSGLCGPWYGRMRATFFNLNKYFAKSGIQTHECNCTLNPRFKNTIWCPILLFMSDFLKGISIKITSICMWKPDGWVVKALDLGFNVHLHAWVRTPLLANIFYLTSNTSNKCVSAWMAMWLRRWIHDPMCICTRGFEKKPFLLNFDYFNQMCKCTLDLKSNALTTRPSRHLHIWLK